MKYKAGDWSISTNFKQLEELVKKYIDEVAPEIQQETEKFRDELQSNLQANWPVKTGKSKAGFTPYTDIVVTNGGAVKFKCGISNSVPYVIWVKQNGKSSWNEQVKKPSAKMTKELSARLVDAVKKV